MSVRPDDHCGLRDLLRIVGLDDVYDIESSGRREATLPMDAGTLGLDLGRDGVGKPLQLSGLPEGFWGETTEDDVGGHGGPPVRNRLEGTLGCYSTSGGSS